MKYLRSLSFIQGTCVNFLRTSILFLMLYLIYLRDITVGQFFSLWIYSFFIFGPLQELGNIINIYREAEVSLNIFERILRIPTEPRPARPRALGDLRELDFDNVTFQHQSATSPAILDISFGVKRGETIAFVGPSGSGKATLVKLLVGLYPPGSGRILYNGIASDQIDLDALRERIGFVTQDTQLFSGTIRENLLFVNPKATDEQCLEALRRSACESLLARAQRGLDTVIGEGGVKVSGGEKQRISIARALLRGPQLLVFDEATSSLDSLTEEGIVETIRDVASTRDSITILIAHRLSTILHADRIYVLERGRIVETGKQTSWSIKRGCTTRCGGSRSASGVGPATRSPHCIPDADAERRSRQLRQLPLQQRLRKRRLLRASRYGHSQYVLDLLRRLHQRPLGRPAASQNLQRTNFLLRDLRGRRGEPLDDD